MSFIRTDETKCDFKGCNELSVGVVMITDSKRSTRLFACQDHAEQTRAAIEDIEELEEGLEDKW